jgi:hypothetical protein
MTQDPPDPKIADRPEKVQADLALFEWRDNDIAWSSREQPGCFAPRGADRRGLRLASDVEATPVRHRLQPIADRAGRRRRAGRKPGR